MIRARHAQRCNANGKPNPRGKCTMVYGHVWLGTGWSRARLRKEVKPTLALGKRLLDQHYAKHALLLAQPET
jgi:hypothetical protein